MTTVSKKITWDEAADLYTNMLEAEKGLAANSVISYADDTQHMAQFFGRRLPRDITISHILRYFEDMRTSYSAATCKRRGSNARQFFTFLHDEGVVPDNPVRNLSPPSADTRLPRALSEAETAHLLTTAKANGTPEGLRLYAMIELLYATGMRVSELAALKMNNLKGFADGNPATTPHIYIIGKGGKERIVPVHKIAVDAVSRYMRIRHRFLPRNAAVTRNIKFLFPLARLDRNGKVQHISRQQIYTALHKLADDTNIARERVYPHALRHSFATHMLGRGMDLRMLQELMGHSSIASTEIYLHVDTERLKRLVEQTHPLGRVEI